ncbi:MAG: DNA repair protein RadA [Eubacteriales bacterium]|nr:DNA repair protein RadA [Eubacteriales bacterium]
MAAVMSAKTVTVYQCSQCGYEARKWLGKCPDCGQWNTLQEQAVQAAPAHMKKAATPVTPGAVPVPLNQVAMEDFDRSSTGIGELNRVLGGGIVPGSLILIGGDPGIGKSTLLLQMANHLAQAGRHVLYVTGEESTRQVALRAARLGADASELYLLAETCVERILHQAQATRPEFIIVDSVQTMYRQDVASSPGSVTQVRESAAALMRLAKEEGCPVFLVGHVTKSGALAGPRVLEHMVDTVLYFEGDEQHAYRILRAVKNRYGSTNEIGIFEMRETGMAEISNPSQMMLHDRADAAGSAVTASMEGSRPVLVEIQSLICSTSFGTPRRMSTGIDYNRMVLLAAVLEKRAGLRLGDQDIYLNVAGGLRLTEPAADLATVMAMASGLRNQRLPQTTAFVGEIGLSGEIRPINRMESRLQECHKAGFHTVLLPQRNLRDLRVPDGLDAVGVAHITDALRLLL